MSERINLVVDDTQKDRWESYVDGTAHFSSVSELIRTSVEKEIKSGEDEAQADIELQGELLEIKELIDENVATKLDEVRVDVKAIRESQEEEDIEDFAKTLFDSLEEIPSDTNVEAFVGTKAGLEPQTAYSLSRTLNATPKRVLEAVNWLQERHYPVVAYELRGEQHFFREE